MGNLFTFLMYVTVFLEISLQDIFYTMMLIIWDSLPLIVKEM